MTAYTKEERWEIYRLAKRARGGLYRAEKQVLNFIAEAQTMQNGVCSKALKGAEDFGHCVRQMRFGLHGRRRKGKLEFPGLIARKIVSASGYVKGGRAPGGAGLTPTYTINRDELLNFIPETDDDAQLEKGEPLDEPLGEPSRKKGEPLGDQVPTSSSSSSLPPAGGQLGENFRADRREGQSGILTEVLTVETQPLVVVGVGETPAQTQNQKRGQRKAESVSQEDRHDQIIADARVRQLERNASDDEIYREYKKVFDRLKRENEIYWGAPSESRATLPRGAHFDNPFQPTEKHKRAAAKLYRALGWKVALAKWEIFLVNEDHTTTTGTPILDENSGAPTGRFYAEEVERMWLLNDFVLNCNPTPDAASTAGEKP